ncbi:MAG: YopX family protein, partial [Candidatus Shapirobacteria bacterium]
PIDCRDSIQQFTGLSDKSGKKIYEGDIVTLRTTSHDYQTKVIFIDGCFAFNVINPQGTLSLVFAHNIASGHFEVEVVGNIFETPELLT